MSKLIAKDYYVSVNGVDLSDHAFNVEGVDEKEQVDMSGFNAAGSKEFLPGQRDQSVTIQFLQDFAASKVHATLTTLYESGSTFLLLLRPTSSAGSATNPSFGGSANLYSYAPLTGSLGQRAEIPATFRPASNTTWAWGTA